MHSAIHWALCLGFLPVVSGCGFIATETATRHESLKVAIPEANEIHVQTQNGKIRCVAGEVDEIEVEVDYKARGYTKEEAETAVERITIEQSNADGIAELTVNVPSDVSGGASVLLTMPKTSVLQLQSSNGAIEVNGITGGVNATTTNGSIQVVDGSGVIQLQSSNGSLTIRGSGLETISATTSNGSVDLKGNLATGSHEIRTSNGAINVELQGTSADIRARMSNGKITVNGKKVEGDSFSVGDDNDSSNLSLTTSNGTIRVQHQAVQKYNPVDPTVLQ